MTLRFPRHLGVCRDRSKIFHADHVSTSRMNNQRSRGKRFFRGFPRILHFFLVDCENPESLEGQTMCNGKRESMPEFSRIVDQIIPIGWWTTSFRGGKGTIRSPLGLKNVVEGKKGTFPRYVSPRLIGRGLSQRKGSQIGINIQAKGWCASTEITRGDVVAFSP